MIRSNWFQCPKAKELSLKIPLRLISLPPFVSLKNAALASTAACCWSIMLSSLSLTRTDKYLSFFLSFGPFFSSFFSFGNLLYHMATWSLWGGGFGRYSSTHTRTHTHAFGIQSAAHLIQQGHVGRTIDWDPYNMRNGSIKSPQTKNTHMLKSRGRT